MKKEEGIMIIDATNAYIRAYIVDPSMSRTSGFPIGGIIGILKIIQKLLTDYRPRRVYICWDGKGSSKKRREINKNYKEGRQTIRLNRDVGLSEEEELKNKIWQQIRAIEYLNQFPFSQIMIDGVEADDIISVLCNIHHKDEDKIIISADKDFIQLVNDKTMLIRPVQEDFFDIQETLNKFSIHPRNFALARSIIGDDSDNLKGIQGAGMKTIAKRFPMLAKDQDIFIDDILTHCNDPNSTQKIFSDVLSGKSVIEENYKIMQLSLPSMSEEAHKTIEECCVFYPFSMNKTMIKAMMIQDGFPYWNFDNLFSFCNRIMNSVSEENEIKE